MFQNNMADPKTSSRSFLRPARMIAILTLASRILGLVRDAICSRYFGAQIMHYFYIPFMIPNLSRRIFGEGALTSALIPVYTQQRQETPATAGQLVNSVLTLLTLVLSTLTLLGIIGIALFRWLGPDQAQTTRIMLDLTMIMLPYMILVCLAAAMSAILNVHDHFSLPALTPLIFNCVFIAGVYLFRGVLGDDPWRQVYVVATAVTVSGFLQVGLLIPILARKGISVRPRMIFHESPVRTIMSLMMPMVVGLTAVQLNTLADNLIAFFLSATEQTGPAFQLFGWTIQYPVAEGSVSYLFYAQRCYQVPLGVFGIALATAIFPYLSRVTALEQRAEFNHIFSQGLRVVLFIGVPATIGLILLRKPLVVALLQGNQFTAADSAATAMTLFYYSLGIVAYFMQQLIIRGFYSFQDSKTPVFVAVRVIALNFILNLILIWPLATGGLALSTAICAMIQVIFLMIILVRRYQLYLKERLTGSILKTLAASAAMAIAGVIAMRLTRSLADVWQLLIVTSLCLATYLGAAAGLKHDELKIFKIK